MEPLCGGHVAEDWIAMGCIRDSPKSCDCDCDCDCCCVDVVVVVPVPVDTEDAPMALVEALEAASDTDAGRAAFEGLTLISSLQLVTFCDCDRLEVSLFSLSGLEDPPSYSMPPKEERSAR